MYGLCFNPVFAIYIYTQYRYDNPTYARVARVVISTKNNCHVNIK